MQSSERNFALEIAKGALAVISLPFSLLRRSARSSGARRQSARCATFDTTHWTAELLKHLEWRRFEELCVAYYQALGFTPPEFAHLSLVMGPDHTPLSKRHGATSVAEFRERGYLPEALVNYLALFGWSPGGDEELLPVDELARWASVPVVNALSSLAR